MFLALPLATALLHTAPPILHTAQPTISPFASKFRCRVVLATSVSTAAQEEDRAWLQWADEAGIIAPKVSVRSIRPEDRGKGGVIATEAIAAMETIAIIPKSHILCPSDAADAAAAGAADDNWATRLTAAALLALHAEGSDKPTAAKQAWLSSWQAGGWATDNGDLGGEDVRWGGRDVTGSLMATGSDNDKAIYAKFRFPCHPVVHRAGLGLAQLTRASKADAIAALQCRGSAYRSMREALFPLVTTPSPRKTGSARERRCWDVADTLSRVLSRATTLELDSDSTGGTARSTCVVVPLHERLAHASSGLENAKLVGQDPRADGDGSSVLLVASRPIAAGESITRDYALAPRLPLDSSDGPLRLLLQFGLPPAAWDAPGSE